MRARGVIVAMVVMVGLVMVLRGGEVECEEASKEMGGPYFYFQNGAVGIGAAFKKVVAWGRREGGKWNMEFYNAGKLKHVWPRENVRWFKDKDTFVGRKGDPFWVRLVRVGTEDSRRVQLKYPGENTTLTVRPFEGLDRERGKSETDEIMVIFMFMKGKGWSVTLLRKTGVIGK